MFFKQHSVWLLQEKQTFALSCLRPMSLTVLPTHNITVVVQNASTMIVERRTIEQESTDNNIAWCNASTTNALKTVVGKFIVADALKTSCCYFCISIAATIVKQLFYAINVSTFIFTQRCGSLDQLMKQSLLGTISSFD